MRCALILEALRGVVLLGLLLSAPAAADVFSAADLRLQTDATAGSYVLVARLPRGVDIDAPVHWPQGCVATTRTQRGFGEGTQLSLRARCPGPPAPDWVIRTPWRLDGARLHLALAAPVDLALPPSPEGLEVPFARVEGPPRPWTQVLPAMVWQGVVHIGIGWDHLAFVLCLAMLFPGLKLLGVVTAFTLGHSLSMGLAFFERVSLPLPPVEALIALSVVLLAREALLLRATGAPPAFARALAVVVLFGLVHGLGFASALGSLGISADERWPALLGFNLGVEIGQVAFVGAVLAVLAALRKMHLDAPARSAALYAAGICGAFWTIQRVAGFVTG
jgi:hypothetical protein